MALCTRQVSASEIARRIGVSRAVLYKWKDKIIGNSAYQTMRKHNEPSLEAERDALRAKWHLNRSQFGIRIDHDLASISDHSLASQSITIWHASDH